MATTEADQIGGQKEKSAGLRSDVLILRLARLLDLLWIIALIDRGLQRTTNPHACKQRRNSAHERQSLHPAAYRELRYESAFIELE